MLQECFGIEGTVVDDLIEGDGRAASTRSWRRGIDYETAQKFNEIDEDDENYPNVRGGLAGRRIIRGPIRTGSMASDVDRVLHMHGNAGAIGIESAYNDILNGTDGREYGYFDNRIPHA